MNASKSSDFSLFIDLRKQGYNHVVGIDEVGRGALAGPLVVVALEINQELSGIKDSKKLSASQRGQLFDPLVQRAEQLSIGQVSNVEIDQLGLAKALKLAYERALNHIQADLLLSDAIAISGQKNIKAIKGDQLFYPTAAASIVAKAYRDQLMRVYHYSFPQYDWKHNMGYGTKNHLVAIEKFGHTRLHRRSFNNQKS